MEIHNIQPLFCENSKVLILGSFPSVKSREQQFFYGHPQNRFWKVISAITDSDLPTTIEEKRKLILDNRIALWDVIAKCDIVDSSDSSIKNVVANDLTTILNTANIQAIFTNGKTAYKHYNKYIFPKIGIDAICLPSTSPANAAFSLNKLIEIWSCELEKYIKE